MDILSRHYKNRVIFRLSLGGGQLMIDDKEINLLGEKEGHLHLPDNVAKIFSSFKQGQSLSKSKTNVSYFQAMDVSRDRSRGRALPGVGRERPLEEPPQSPRRKTPEKGKLKATLTDIKTPPEDSSKRLGKKDFERPDIILAKKEELEKLFKRHNVIKSVPCAPKHSEIMRTTWVITEKTDNMSKTGSTVKGTMYNGELRERVLQGLCPI